MTVSDEKTHLWTLPNRLSLIRILSIPVIVFFISSQEEELIFASCLIFIVAGITDGLDGFMARKMKLTTKLGLYLDPLADKLLVSSVLITLTYYRFVPLWVTILLVAREFLINGLRSFYAMEGIAVYPSKTGKIKTALQLVGIACILLNHSFEKPPLFPGPVEPGMIIIYAALFFSLYSATKYMGVLFKPAKDR